MLSKSVEQICKRHMGGESTEQRFIHPFRKRRRDLKNIEWSLKILFIFRKAMDID